MCGLFCLSGGVLALAISKDKDALGIHPRICPHPDLNGELVSTTLYRVGGDAAAPTQICQPLGGKKSAAATAAWATTEARTSGRWSHPNIVRALKHCSVLTPGAPQPAAAQHTRACLLSCSRSPALRSIAIRIAP